MFKKPLFDFFRLMKNSNFISNLACGFSILIFASSFAVAQDGSWAVTGRAGTLGFGAEVHRLLVPEILSFRTGAQFYRGSADLTVDGIDYDSALTLGTVPVALDVYPFKNWFRLSGGIMIDFNGASGIAEPKEGQITINGVPYSSDQIGRLNASIKLNRVAPFFGVGFGRTLKKEKRWGITLDIGAMYQGAMKLSLTATQPAASQLQDDLRRQEQLFNNDFSRFKLYPIVQFGVSYRLGSWR